MLEANDDQLVLLHVHMQLMTCAAYVMLQWEARCCRRLPGWVRPTRSLLYFQPTSPPSSDTSP